TWRWSLAAWEDYLAGIVLSTHVEVVRRCATQGTGVDRALHARGGGPRGGAAAQQYRECSPRTWRWSVMIADVTGYGGVSSTHVEVVRPGMARHRSTASALHARGGGP